MANASNVNNFIKDQFSNAENKTREATHSIEDKAYELGTKVKSLYNNVVDGRSTLEEKVKENPIISVGLAFLGGIILNKLFQTKG